MLSIRKIILLFVFIFWCNLVYATDYYVSPNGGTGTGSINDPWKLSHANAQLKAGDRAILRGGMYIDQFIKPVNSGDDGKPITYMAYSGKKPEFRGSKNGAIPVLINLTGHSYITVDGIAADGEKIYKDSHIDTWVSFINSSYCTVKNSTFFRSKGWAAIGFDNSHYNKFINNEVDTNGMWDALAWRGVHDDSGTMFKLQKGSSYNLIEGNMFRRSGHDMGGLLPSAGPYNIIRNNTFENDWGVYTGEAFTHKAGDIAPGDRVGNRTLEIKGGTYTLIENNIFKNVPESVDNSSVAMIKVNGIKAIVRNNLFINGNHDGIQTAPGSSAPRSEYNRIFHNVFYNLGGPAWRIEAYQNDYGSPNNNEFKNNIVYKTHTNPSSGKFDVEFSFLSLVKFWNDAFLDNKVVYNCMAFDDTASKQQGYTQTSGTKSLTQLETSYPTYFNNNLQVAPSFVNAQPQYSLNDFRLSAGSACKNAGGDLTVTTNSGTGKIFRVADVSYFSDGCGLIQGDLIKVGANPAVRISKVNYNTNEITVESNISWAKNNGVNLNYSGKGPDMGLAGATSPLLPNAPSDFTVR